MQTTNTFSLLFLYFRTKRIFFLIKKFLCLYKKISLQLFIRLYFNIKPFMLVLSRIILFKVFLTLKYFSDFISFCIFFPFFSHVFNFYCIKIPFYDTFILLTFKFVFPFLPNSLFSVLKKNF